MIYITAFPLSLFYLTTTHMDVSFEARESGTVELYFTTKPIAVLVIILIRQATSFLFPFK